MDVRFHATLRQVVGGKYVSADWHEGLTVRGFLNQMVAQYPKLGPHLFDRDGALYRHVHVMVNGRDAPYLERGLDTPLGPADRLDIFPPVGGG